MIKSFIASPRGMSKDLASDKQSDKYFDAKNIRILATDQKSSFAITNEAGNELVFTIPSPSLNTTDTTIDYVVSGVNKSLKYTANNTSPRCELEAVYDGKTSGTQTIIGTKDLRDSALIITTDNNGFDCFWELTGLNESTFDLVLLYMNNLGLSTGRPVQTLFNYENSVIQKIYFVDGEHQLRYFNLKQSIENGDTKNLIDLESSAIDTVSTATLSQIKIESVIGGGSHTTGMIQYAYGLYILNGAQTTISPLSILTPIDKGNNLGGGEVNENLGRTVNISILDIDNKFTHIKIYSIKYTSYNEIPEIKIISDQPIDNFDKLTFSDTGSATETISLDSFVFLGSSPIVPKHIEIKDNRLFPINITEQNFDVDVDCRAYSHDNNGNCIIMENPYIQSGIIKGASKTVNTSTYDVPKTHDAINRNYNIYKYQSNGTTLGASGKNVNIEIVQSSLNQNEAKNYQFLKDREIYRFAIEFYNRRGQYSFPKWIADLRMPEGNLQGNYNQLKVTLTPEFYVWLNTSSNFASEDDKPIGYKILRANRTLSDQTIYAQGMINPTVSNYSTPRKQKGEFCNLPAIKDIVNTGKSDNMPSVTRMFERMIPFHGCQDYLPLASKSTTISFSNLGRTTETEGFKSAIADDFKAMTFQNSRLMQFFSPEVLFKEGYEIDSSYKLKILGLAKQKFAGNWGTEENPITGEVADEAIFNNGINELGANDYETKVGNAKHLFNYGFFGPTNANDQRSTSHMYRDFTDSFYKRVNDRDPYDIYGTPEITEAGAANTRYNGDDAFKYANHLRNMLMDDWRKSDDAGSGANHIKGCNTIGAKCITFAEGPDTNVDPASRKSIETLHSESGIIETEGVLIAEFVRDESVLYIGNIYGGFTYENKSQASYIQIGEFTNINTNSVTIQSPGDTFVYPFTFSKLVKDDVEIKSTSHNLVAEIVTIPVETTIDLKNRSDLSIGEWNNVRQPRYEEYQEYNSVYSQQPTLITNTGLGSKFKKIAEFDGRIMSSKEKIPGEFIDSWTDFLENETMDLDGKYGPINAVVNLRDEIYCLQDSAVAKIAINPRVQVKPDDGVSLELGTGGILHDYAYLSTTVGTLNKWGVATTENAFYFVDPINKGIMTFDGSRVARLSDLKGFHHEFLNTMNFDELKLDNPVLGTGISTGYNSTNADVYFTFLQSNPFTIAFNEKIGEFVSYYDYKPAWYIGKGSTMITTDPTNTSVWEHFKGTPNHFYGTHHRSQVTFNVAPQGDEIILNGASYKLELTDSEGTEIIDKGLTGIRVYNDYQDSGVKTLVLRKNAFKRFRNWKINFPRNAGGRDRVRSAWGFAEFSFDNNDGNKLILHDITIFFTQH